MHDLIIFKDAVICDLITVGCDLITSSTAVVLQARSRRLSLTLNFRTVILPSATAVVLNSRAICTHATRRGHWAVCQHISRRRLTGLARHLLQPYVSVFSMRPKSVMVVGACLALLLHPSWPSCPADRKRVTLSCSVSAKCYSVFHTTNSAIVGTETETENGLISLLSLEQEELVRQP